MSDFSKLVDQVALGKRMNEVSPPGSEGTVRAMKKSGEVDNPYALAWWQKQKGYKSHKKASGAPKNEDFGSKHRNQLRPGDRVVMVGGGIDDGKHGEIVNKREIKLNGHGIPVNVSDNPYKPVDWNKEVAVRFDDGGLRTMFKNYLRPEPTTEDGSTGTPSSVEGGESSVSTGLGAGLTPGEIQDIEMESIVVDHPNKGLGEIIEINDNDIVVEWRNLQLRILGPERVPFSEAKYLFRVDERYSSDPHDAEVDDDEDDDTENEKGKKIKEGGLAAAPVPETDGDLATQPPHDGSDWTPGLEEDPDDAPDVTDFQPPSKNEDGVRSVVDAGVRDDMRGKAHQHDNRKGTRTKVHSHEGRETMTVKNKKLDEHMVAIQGTYRGNPDRLDVPDLDLTFNDLLEYDVPEPEDSVLTTGDQAKNEKIPPLSTEAGASAAHDSQYPDGDMADDTPDDAPDTPKYDNIDDGGNEREAATGVKPSADLSGSKKKNKSYDSSGSHESDDDSTTDEEKNEMDESILSWKDIGLRIDEECCGGAGGECECGDKMREDGGCECEKGKPSMSNMREDDGESGGVSLSRDLLDRLLKDIRDQQPDEEKLGYISSGIEAASREKGSQLGIEDIQMIMGEIKEAFGGQDVDNDGDVGGEQVDNAPEQQDDSYASDEMDSPNSVGNETDGDYEYEDKAVGDGEVAGSEGGEEHKGRTKLMDRTRNNEAEGASGPTGGFGNEKENKNIAPISKSSSKGSGPGGSNSDNYGQSDNIPAVSKGSERATPGGPLSKEGGGRNVPPISESEQIDETMVAIGMAAIGGVMRSYGDGPDIDPSDPDAEIKMIRRRAGLENWWKMP